MRTDHKQLERTDLQCQRAGQRGAFVDLRRHVRAGIAEHAVQRVRDEGEEIGHRVDAREDEETDEHGRLLLMRRADGLGVDELDDGPRDGRRLGQVQRARGDADVGHVGVDRGAAVGVAIVESPLIRGEGAPGDDAVVGEAFAQPRPALLKQLATAADLDPVRADDLKVVKG